MLKTSGSDGISLLLGFWAGIPFPQLYPPNPAETPGISTDSLDIVMETGAAYEPTMQQHGSPSP